MANNNDWHTPGASLILPFGGVPPYVVLSGDASQLPADLIAFYAGFGEDVVAGIVFQSAGVAYDYQVFLTAVGGPAVAFGGKSNAGTISEAVRYQPQFGTAFWDFGLHGNVNVFMRNGGDFQFIQASSLLVYDGSNFTVRDGASAVFGTASGAAVTVEYENGFVNVAADAEWRIDSNIWQFQTGSIATWESGSELQVDSGATAEIAGIPILSGFRGSVNVVFVAATDAGATVNFPSAFAANPIMTFGVATGIGGTAGAGVRLTSISTTQFSISVHLNAAASLTVPVHWHAIA